MERLYKVYGDAIEFVIVYIREAHPEMLRDGNKTGVVGRPDNLDERLILATECVSRYKFTIPAVIDGMDHKVDKDYQAKPVRVTITDKEGRVAYYAGPGPFDFRLSKVDKVLEKLVANGGFMPPAPPPQWGKPVDGLRFGLSVDPPNPLPGEEVALNLSFQNVEKDPIYIYYGVRDPFENLTIQNADGRSLKLVAAASKDFMASRRGGYRIFPMQLAAGERFDTDIAAKLDGATGPDCADGNPYEARYTFAVDEEMVGPIRRYRDLPYWQGSVTSGAFGLSVTRPAAQTCMSCHGVEDYHHYEDQDCSICHIGKEDTEEFTINKTACAKCHPRDGVQGRPMIPKEGKTSPHLDPAEGDGACAKCHDQNSHQKGEIVLLDPFSRGKRGWSGTKTEFCLRCHGAEPPPGLRFPEAKGSGYDKSAFRGSEAFEYGLSCIDCHSAHGADLPSLLLGEELESPHE